MDIDGDGPNPRKGKNSAKSARKAANRRERKLLKQNRKPGKYADAVNNMKMESQDKQLSEGTGHRPGRALKHEGGHHDIKEEDDFSRVQQDFRSAMNDDIHRQVWQSLLKLGQRKLKKDKKYERNMIRQSELNGLGKGKDRCRGRIQADHADHVMKVVDQTEMDGCSKGAGHRGGARSGRPRPPPHLKGREIGMWYANRNKEKREGNAEQREVESKNEERKNRTFVTLDAAKERQLNHLLSSLNPEFVCKQELNTSDYEGASASSAPLMNHSNKSTIHGNNLPFWKQSGNTASSGLQDDPGLDDQDHWADGRNRGFPNNDHWRGNRNQDAQFRQHQRGGQNQRFQNQDHWRDDWDLEAEDQDYRNVGRNQRLPYREQSMGGQDRRFDDQYEDSSNSFKFRQQSRFREKSHRGNRGHHQGYPHKQGSRPTENNWSNRGRGNDRFHWSKPTNDSRNVGDSHKQLNHGAGNNFESTFVDRSNSGGSVKNERIGEDGDPIEERCEWFIDRRPSNLGSRCNQYDIGLKHPETKYVSGLPVALDSMSVTSSSADINTTGLAGVESVNDRFGSSVNMDAEEKEEQDIDDDILSVTDCIVLDELGDDDDDNDDDEDLIIGEDDNDEKDLLVMDDDDDYFEIADDDDDDDNDCVDDYDPIVVEESPDEDDGIGDFLAEFHAHTKYDNSVIEIDCGKSLQRDATLDQKLIKEQSDKMKQWSYSDMLKKRSLLPSFQMKEKVIEAVNKSQVLVISGETGCGKTTQVTQFILDDWITRGQGSLCRIVCTQPRRISAITVAERVADERCEPIGQSVGYQIRLEQKLARSQGSILYCTTGILLKWLVSDPWLSMTTHVILDEVHERDTLTDFLMIVLRDLVLRRSDLKLILMSATLNATQFSTYFNNCSMLHIPGFTFPVEHFYLEDILETTRYTRDENDAKRLSRFPPGGNKKMLRELERMYQAWVSGLDAKYSSATRKALQNMSYTESDVDYKFVACVVQHILRTTQDGAILIFMPGWEQIKKTIEVINDKVKFQNGRLLVIPLHSLMPTTNQREVFDHPPKGVRKIIVATNIAETSITIDDVVYVIDCGKIKMKNFDVASNISTLQAEWVSRANAKQRAGRAGRVQAGQCYHLYTTLHESQLIDYQLPEILRTRLEELCLQIKMLKLGGIQEFISKALEPPSTEALEHAIKVLRSLNALDANEALTPLGYHLAKMPVDPQTGKMLLFAALFSCLDPILTIAASLSFKDAFFAPLGKEQLVDARKRQIASGSKSDHLMLAYAFRGWEKAKGHGYGAAKHYCRENFLSESILQMLAGMRRQFSKTLCDMKFLASSDPKSYEANRNSGNASLVKAIISAGLYPNVARRKPHKGKKIKKGPLTLMTRTEKKVAIHPKSVNASETEFVSDWFVYHLIMKTSKIYIYDSTSISPYPLMFFGGEITTRKDLGENCIIIDDWIKFGASKKTSTLVLALRRELDKLMRYKITHPGAISWKTAEEGDLMAAIIDLVTTEMHSSNRHQEQHAGQH